MSHFETRPSFLHWNSAKLFATLKAPVFITWSQCVPCVSMLQRTRHASIPSTCATPCNAMQRHATPCNAMQRHATPCNAMLHCFHSKHFLGSTEICVQHWIFVVRIEKNEFQSADCFRHLCAREWLKKFADKTELWEHEMQSETVRRLTSLLLAPLLQRGPGVLAESLTSHWDAWSCKRLSSIYVSLGLNPFTTQW